MTKRIGNPCVILRPSAPFRPDERDGRTYNSRHVLFFSPIFSFSLHFFLGSKVSKVLAWDSCDHCQGRGQDFTE